MRIQELTQDLRGALRMMRRDPGFTAVAVLTLALGIGATTAIVNVVDALLVGPLPYPEAERLVVLYATTPKSGVTRDTTSFLDFTAWRSESHAFVDAAAYGQGQFNITGDGAPESVLGVRATSELLPVLGVTPIIGRAPDRQEQREAQTVALISHSLWTRRYGRDPAILGRTILLNDIAHSVIGVLPPPFQFPAFQDADVIVPVQERTCRSCGYVRGIARLKPDVPASAAQMELDTIAARRAAAFPDSNAGRGVNVVALQEVAVGHVHTPLLVLLGAGVFVLLIGCGNVGNLVLARGIARQRELAVRSALGAGAGRLVRQVLTESVCLALIAAVLGAGLAFLGSDLLVTSLSQRFPLPQVPFNVTLLASALVIAMLSGLVTGLPPALMVWRSDLNGSLKQDARSQSGGLTQQRLRSLLVVSQTALTVMLLIGAGLLVKSFVLLRQAEIGLDPRHVLNADLVLAARYGDPVRREAFLREVVDAIQALPGVRHVGLQTDSAYDGGGRQDAISIDGLGDPAQDRGHGARCNYVNGDLFRAVGMTMARGRAFDARDTVNSPPVAVINESMARTFWPNDDAIGKRLRLYYDKDPHRWITVVGIVRDAHYRYEETGGRSRRYPSQFFLSQPQHPLNAMSPRSPFVSLVVRTAGDPAGVAASLRAAIWAIDKNQPILNVESMEGILWQSVAAPRIYTLLLGLFAAIALVIASAGLYGVSAYAVVRRTREIGIRLAVGATTRQILTLMLRHGLTLTTVGVVIGVAGAFALTNVISAFLFGISATDAPTVATVVVVFVTIAFVSTYIPARRAAKTDPTVAFRFD